MGDVVGHDIGTMVAYAYAARDSGKTTKLVLVDARAGHAPVGADCALAGAVALRLHRYARTAFDGLQRYKQAAVGTGGRPLDCGASPHSWRAHLCRRTAMYAPITPVAE